MNKTLEQILLEIHQVRPCSRRQLFRYLKTLEIKPVAARQRPQRYPANATAQILNYLGMIVVPLETKVISIKEAKRRSGKGGK